MPESPGVLKVRNRAFRLLGGMLDLPGGEGVEFIDVDHASPVLGLDSLLVRQLTTRWIFTEIIITTGGGTIDDSELDFGDSAGWNTVVAVGHEAGAQAVPRDHDIWITGFNGQGSADIDMVGFYIQRGGGAVGRALYRADRFVVNSFWSQGMTSGQSGWIEPPPVFFDRDLYDGVTMFVRDTGAGADNPVFTFELLTAPQGVLPVIL